MKPILFLAAMLFAAASGAAGENARRALVIDDIEWTLREPAPATGQGRQLTISSHGSINSASLERGEFDDLRWNEVEQGFTLEREAGKLACRGKTSGTCRFTGSLDYEEALAERGLELEHRRDLLALALVDATTALVDDLAREGYPIRKDGDLMAVAALKVTGAYSRALRAEGLRARGIDDLVACRALGIDGDFLRAMAAAGYASLEARDAIALRAVGVTPAYADTMNRLAGAVRAVDAAGELQ